MESTLFARSQDGHIKIWTIDDSVAGYITISTGRLGGKLYSRLSKITKKDEFISLVRAKQREGYKTILDICSITKVEEPSTITAQWLNGNLPITNVDINYNLIVMKCQPFKKGKVYPRAAQPKLNGIRGVIRLEEITTGIGMFAETKKVAVCRSKSGIRYYVPHITDLFTETMFDSPIGTLVFDGELYIHGMMLNKINSAVPMQYDNGVIAKSSRPELVPRITFNIFDLAIDDVLQMDRLTQLIIFKQELKEANIDKLQVVDYDIIYNDEQALEIAKRYVTQGYEGGVFRELDATYKFGSRPVSIMKLKFVQDGEFEIVDITPKDKEPETAMFLLKNDINDETFECNPMGDYEERKEYLDNKSKYIGQMATVKYYERSGVKQCPFHANVVTVRNYE